MNDDRLPPPFGAWIDRDRPVSFNFEGRRYTGFAGDTIASALAANGIRLLSRSFKYHRPRGVLTMTGDDANTLVQIGDRPNVLADTEPIREGMTVTGQHYGGSLIGDSGRWIERFHRFLPVGFYYRAFYRPRGIWPWWEKLVRRMAGLGQVALDATPGRYDKQYLFARTAVIGGGAAGLAAALAAAGDGGDVVLIERQPVLGGSLNHARFDAGGDRGATLLADVTAHDGIRAMTASVCTGWFADNYLSVLQGTRLYKLRAAKMVLATGALEQPLVFANNDLPGIMFASAAQRLIRLYGVRPGSRAVVACANDDGFGAALDLIDAGVEIAAIVDLNAEPSCGPLARAATARGVEILTGWTIREAIAAEGGNGLGAVIAAPVCGRGETGDDSRRFACDLLCVSVGWTPAAALAAHAGAAVAYDEAVNGFAVNEVPDGMRLAGAVNGVWDLGAAIADGSGKAAERDCVSHPWPIFPHAKGKDFVDFDEDLTVADLRNAVADGFEDIELVKRFSTVGMGPSQGRQSAANAVRLVREANGRPLQGAIGTTNRPPAFPETLGLLAGRPYHPVRLSAMHHRHLEAGASMLVASAWLRPAYYGAATEIVAEVAAVRGNVAAMDVSTLGGLEIRGPGAAEFLERIYTMAYATLPVGRSRYVLMCNELGTMVDDGVACRLAAEHFYVTATTGNSDGVYREMLFRNTQWRLDVDIANVTGAMAAVNIAGPLSRRVLARICDDPDLSAEAFPYLGVRVGTVAGIPARLIRVGFVGELGYEIHVPASRGEALWDAVLEAGREDGIRPFGVEAQRILRLEKGHIIIGQDSDALTHPHEVAMGWALGHRKAYFTGARGIEMRMKGGLTRLLTGFTLPPDTAILPEESQLVLRNGDIAGRVTSIARSPTLGRPIGLAFVAPDQATPGTRLTIKGPRGRVIEAQTVALPFYDPDNKRQAL